MYSIDKLVFKSFLSTISAYKAKKKKVCFGGC